MVVERQPPRDGTSSRKEPSDQRISETFRPPIMHGLNNQPAFGQTSQLRSPLRASDVFNIPKPNRPRPEHHRIGHASIKFSQGSQSIEDRVRDPFAPRPPKTNEQPSIVDLDSSVVEIQAPAPPVTFSSYRSQPPKFSSFEPSRNSFQPVSNYGADPQLDGVIDVDAALFRDKFRDEDLLTPVDAAQTNKEMKALLEGAFGDDDDKPKSRGQRRKLEKKVHDMVEKAKKLSMGSSAGADDEEEEEEEIDDGTREGLKVKLLPHQIDGVEWMLARELGKKKVKGYLTKGGILADDMGLGKTIQTITLILLNPRGKDDARKISKSVGKTTLVVAPLALIQQWSREIEEKVENTHALKILVHHGPKRTKRGDDLRKYDVVITTYQTVMSEHENSSKTGDGPKIGCFGVHWYRVVLDEAHSIKNRTAKSTKACYALNSEYRWCLTGTPMQNHLDELHSLIHFLRIRPMEDRAVWKSQIITPMSNGKGGLAIRRLQVYLQAFMKRRTKDVLREQNGLGNGTQNQNRFKLVDRKVEKIEGVFMAKEREYYDLLEQRADKSLEKMMDAKKLNYASALTLLLRLRQACNHKELIKKSLSKDVDALTVKESQTPRKPKGGQQDIDDIADLLGDLTVEAKQCNVCLAELTDEEVSSRMVRCADCEAGLADDEEVRPRKTKAGKKNEKKKSSQAQPKARIARRERTRRIVDDSDEEEEGDWVVPENERSTANLGKVGGTDDENADGGGDWLGSEDSETDDESSTKMLSQKKKVISLATSEEDEQSSAAEESDEEISSDESEDVNSEDSETAASTSVVASTKIHHLMKILHRECSEHKFIVYSQFTSMLDLIEPFLRKEGITYCRYDGKMRNDLREASLEKLRNDKRVRVLLCSLKCGSLGLNLTAASRVVILEPFWNPVKHF